MKIEVNFNRKTFFIIACLAVLIGGLFIVTAWNPNLPSHPLTQVSYANNCINPPCPLVSIDNDNNGRIDDARVDPGTFGGNASSRWGLLGNLGVGTVNPNAKFHVRTNGWIVVEGTNPAGAASPGIMFRENIINNSKYWGMFKRGSDYAAAGQKDSFIISYYNGSSWKNALQLNPDGTACIGNSCQTTTSTSQGTSAPIGTWCGRSWIGQSNAQKGIKCDTFWPSAITSSCPSGYTKTEIGSNPDLGSGSPGIFTCIKTS